MLFKTLLVVLLAFAGTIQSESNADIINTNVERTIDLTSHLPKVINLVSVENQGSKSLNSYVYVVEPEYEDKIAYVGAQVSFIKNF
jgi:hypothetical protein